MASQYSADDPTVSVVSEGSSSQSTTGLVSPPSEMATGATSEAIQFSGRGRLAAITGVQILSTGSYVPSEIVRNEDLAQLGCDANWILQRTGIDLPGDFDIGRFYVHLYVARCFCPEAGSETAHRMRRDFMIDQVIGPLPVRPSVRNGRRHDVRQCPEPPLASCSGVAPGVPLHPV